MSPPSTRVKNFQRVEPLVAGDEIEQARDTFTTLLGASFSPLRLDAEQLYGFALTFTERRPREHL